MPSFIVCVEYGTNLAVESPVRVFTAKCSEPQVSISNGMDGGSGVAKFLSLRTET